MEKRFFNWMENIQPWCVSRQLWWGHRIPAWYGIAKPTSGETFRDRLKSVLDGKMENVVFVAETEAQALQQAKVYYGPDCDVFVEADGQQPDFENIERSTFYIKRDEDVLDTWFSSALWPFATLGWPVLRDGPSTSSVPPQDERFLLVSRSS
jgi:valyl-tRNA synthetase